MWQNHTLVKSNILSRQLNLGKDSQDHFQTMNLNPTWASVLAGIKPPSALWSQVHTQNLQQELCCSHYRSPPKYEEMEKESIYMWD